MAASAMKAGGMKSKEREASGNVGRVLVGFPVGHGDGLVPVGGPVGACGMAVVLRTVDERLAAVCTEGLFPELLAIR